MDEREDDVCHDLQAEAVSPVPRPVPRPRTRTAKASSSAGPTQSPDTAVPMPVPAPRTKKPVTSVCSTSEPRVQGAHFYQSTLSFSMSHSSSQETKIRGRSESLKRPGPPTKPKPKAGNIRERKSKSMLLHEQEHRELAQSPLDTEKDFDIMLPSRCVDDYFKADGADPNTRSQGQVKGLAHKGSIVSKVTKGFTTVKSAIGALTGVMMGANESEFASQCKATFKTLQKLHSVYGESIIDKKTMQDILRTASEVDKRDICISIFGEHNCGKSTFLNALIGENILPTHYLSETSVKIEVKHDSRVHLGPCSQQYCSQYSSMAWQCPTLHTKDAVVIGSEEIKKYLKKLNKSVRDKKAEPPSVMVLTVYLPLLEERVPAGWTVKLVDNPGFGEAKEHVTQLADASLSNSSAYIYLFQPENIGGKQAAEFFKELSRRDREAICDGRLTIGISKFDSIASSIESDFGTAVKEVTDRVIQSIHEHIGDQVSESIIIPLCSKWALNSSRLRRHLDAGSDAKELMEKALTDIQNCTFFDLECGQGQTPREAIKSQFKDPHRVVETLSDISGATTLKERIRDIGSTCVKAWATKLKSQFCFYVEETQEKLVEAWKFQDNELKRKRKPYEQSRWLQSDVVRQKEKINATVVSGKKKTFTTLWKDFETSYDLDLKASEPHNTGITVAKMLVENFKHECKEKIAERTLGPQEFEADLHRFLDESAQKLQNTFDGACGFRHVQDTLYKHRVDAVSDIEALRNSAGRLCGTSAETLESDRLLSKKEIQESRPLTVPNLGDIKLQVKIPMVTLPWWEKIMQFFRLLGRRKNTTPLGIHERDVITKEQPEAGVTSSTLSSEALEECEIHQQDSKEATLSRENHPGTPGSNLMYRKWTLELDETVDKVLNLMEEVCDNYFMDIKHKAIKFFYKQYCSETSKRMKQFDRDYSSRLEKCGKSLDKDAKDIDSMVKEIANLKTKKDELDSLKADIINKFAILSKRLEFSS